MGQARPFSELDIREGAKRLWQDFDSGALHEAEQRRDDAPPKTWERRWWDAIASELQRTPRSPPGGPEGLPAQEEAERLV